jgi:glc operon protein GlcG
MRATRPPSLLAAALCLAGAAAHAQAPAPAPASPLVDARRVGEAAATRILEAAEAEARRNGWAVSIAVVDPGGALVAFRRHDAAFPASVDLSLGKARTAARFHTTSRAMEELATARHGFLAVDGLTPVEGGVPIVVEGRVVGAVGVSGVASPQDAQVARAGADAVARPAPPR